MTLVIYIPIELIVWTGFFLDEIFFPKFHDIKINQPIFIIGNPRSGTTFLQRLMARDPVNFLSMNNARNRSAADASKLPRVKVPSKMQSWIRVPSSTWLISGMTISVSEIGYLFMRGRGKKEE